MLAIEAVNKSVEISEDSLVIEEVEVEKTDYVKIAKIAYELN